MVLHQLLLFCALGFAPTFTVSSPTHPNHICETQADCTGNFMVCRGRDNRCVCDEDEERRVEPLLSLLTSSETGFEENNSHLCRGVALVGDYCDNATFICTSNATCNPNSRSCECIPGFEVYSHSKECKRPYGQACHEKWEMCNPEKFLTCSDSDSLNNSTCVCSEPDLQYLRSLGTCVVAVGRQCELTDWTGIQLKCGENMECAAEDVHNIHYGVCRCMSGFYSIGDNKLQHKCLPIFGKFCNSSGKDCEHTDYICSEDKKMCECKPNLVYDISQTSTKSGCKLGVGQNCSNSGMNCVDNALCIPDLITGSISCKCNEDFVPTIEGICQMGLGVINCSTGTCHKESGLVCLKDNKCGCRERHIYDYEKRRCVGVHGTVCDISEPKCTQHSTCDLSHNVCRCNSSLAVDEKGLCYHGFGSICDLSRSDQCPAELGMSCQSQANSNDHFARCSCTLHNGTIYDETVEKCLLKVGEPCNYLVNSQRRCIKRAFCGMGDRCQCYSGYSSTPGGDCLVSFGNVCSEEEDYEDADYDVKIRVALQCNSYYGLECVQNKCQCSSGKVFNESLGQCEIKNNEPTSTEASDIMKSHSNSMTANVANSSTMATPALKLNMNVLYWGVGLGLLGIMCTLLSYYMRKVVK